MGLLAKIPSRSLIILCLFLVVSVLFLRNIIYYDSDFQMENGAMTYGSDEEKKPIILSFHDRPPYYFSHSSLGLAGICGETARTVFESSGLDFTIQQMPASRELKLILRNSARICSVGWFRTSERETMAQFTNPIYQDNSMVVLTRTDNQRVSKASRLAQLLAHLDLTLLVKNGYSYGHAIDKEIKRLSPNILTTSGNLEAMINMIVSNKADYLLISQEEVKDLNLRQVMPVSVEVKELQDMPEGNLRYLLCSNQVSPEEIDILNSAISANLAKTAEPETEMQ